MDEIWCLMQIFKAAGVPIEWEEHHVGTTVDPRTKSFVTFDSMESVRKNGIGLKGPMTTPIGKGHKSLNLTLRKELGLYANVRPCLSIPGYKTRYDNVNLVTIRENTEGEYSGLEHQVSTGFFFICCDHLFLSNQHSCETGPTFVVTLHAILS